MVIPCALLRTLYSHRNCLAPFQSHVTHNVDGNLNRNFTHWDMCTIANRKIFMAYHTESVFIVSLLCSYIKRKVQLIMLIWMYPNILILNIQYIPRNMHTVFALLCFVVVIPWLIFPYPSGLLHWHCGNLTIAPVPARQPWWIWKNTSCEFIMHDCITTTKQSTTKPCAYFLGYTVHTYTEVMSGTFQYTLSIMNLVCVIVFNCSLVPVDLPISLSVAILPPGHLYVDWIQQCLASHWQASNA